MKAFHEVRKFASDFKVWHSRYTDISFLAHWHKELELIYVRSGSAHISITDHIFTAEAGDLILCDSGDIHYSDSSDSKNCLDFIVFDTAVISSRYEYSGFFYPLVTKASLQEWGLEAPLLQLIHTVESELGSRGTYYQEIITAALRQFWYQLKRCMRTQKEDDLPPVTERTETDLPDKRRLMLGAFQSLLVYLDEHYMEPITLEFAAEYMHFSPSYFSKVFKRLAGINFITYLNMARIEQAAELLLENELNISAIALQCGFNNIRSFNRVFKELTGITPSQYCKRSDTDYLYLSYYKRKSPEPQYVENDSLTVVKNTPNPGRSEAP